MKKFPCIINKAVFIFVVSFFMLSVPCRTLANTYKFPPFPSDNHSIESQIIQLKQPLTKQEIDVVVKQCRGCQMGYIYQEIFHGFSVKGPANEIQKLKSIGTVQEVFPSFTYRLDAMKYPLAKTLQLQNSVDYIGTDDIRYLLDQKGNTLTGKGIKIGIIDTGIDYQHPDLKHAYKKGYDFIDNDSDPMETKNQGPLDTFHGTHVAGVIAAKGRMTGMAPDAEIYAYRALGPGGYGTTEQILAAIDQAIKDQVDVLNLSLGISINGPDLPISLALDKAVSKGIIAVTSNGNSGPNLWTVGSPGTSHNAISVGASSPILKIPYLAYSGLEVRIQPFLGSKDWKQLKSFQIQYGGIGKPEELGQVKGKVALIERGELTFTEKVENAKKQGAIGVLIYNNVEGEFLGELQLDEYYPVASITKQEGEQLLELIKKENTYGTIKMKTEQDTLASFSSRGPVTFTWDIKPDVVAPGVAIISTVPGGYAPLQGTSMAAPHVAGASALLKQAYPEWTPEQIKSVLMNTSKPLLNENQEFYQTYEQGAGRIQVEKAIRATSIVTPGALMFGKARGVHFEEKKRVITVENVSNETIRYSFKIPKRDQFIVWDFPPPFYLKPHEKKTIPIVMEVKEDHRENEIYNGYIELVAGNQTISLPYLYVVKEPNYPRIMSFTFAPLEERGKYQYEVYLPGGADQFMIALFDPDTYQFVEILDAEKYVNRGLIKKELSIKDKIKPGLYVGVAVAKKGNQEDYIETLIEITEN